MSHIARQRRAALLGLSDSNHHRLVGGRFRKKPLRSGMELCREHIQQPWPQVKKRKRETCGSFVQQEALKLRIYESLGSTAAGPWKCPTSSSDLERLQQNRSWYFTEGSPNSHVNARMQLYSSKEENKHRHLWRGTKWHHHHEKPFPWVTWSFPAPSPAPRGRKCQAAPSEQPDYIIAFCSMAEFRSCLHDY